MENDKTLPDDFGELAKKAKGENMNCWREHEPQSVCPRCGYCPVCGRGGHQIPYYPEPYPWLDEPWRITYTGIDYGNSTLKVA